MTRSNGFRTLVLFPLAMAAMSGCRSDLGQQLLERELRLQEDQIYQLQDELHFKGSRLDRLAVENASLKKQLGIVDADASLPRGSSPPPGVAGPARPAATPTLTAPSVEAPALEFVPPPKPAAGQPSPPAAVPQGPPQLDGVPPLPGAGGLDFRGSSLGKPAGTDRTAVAMPAEPKPIDAGAAAAPPPVRRLSHEESVADEKDITHLVINTGQSRPYDRDGDGRPDGLTVVFEPRDADERLVGSAGDVFVAVFDASAPPDSPPVATWQIPARESLGRFRPTSRARGLQFDLRFPDGPPSADRLRLLVRMTTFEGKTFEREDTLGE